eukprot:gb/GECH01011786.1/.p1 GENE.gb/GECH01011786.1/~~gb/GECH01011786.1/.p1  ORF type:complete len:195 (+),score=34.48 gb/GECH01011786.1/:1-585(+)
MSRSMARAAWRRPLSNSVRSMIQASVDQISARDRPSPQGLKMAKLDPYGPEFKAEKALAKFNLQKQYSKNMHILQYNNVIKHVAYSKQNDRAKFLLMDMIQENIKPDHETFGLLLGTTTSARNSLRAHHYVSIMAKQELSLPKEFIDILIKLCEQTNDKKGAEVYKKLSNLAQNGKVAPEVYGPMIQPLVAELQ